MKHWACVNHYGWFTIVGDENKPKLNGNKEIVEVIGTFDVSMVPLNKIIGAIGKTWFVRKD